MLTNYATVCKLLNLSGLHWKVEKPLKSRSEYALIPRVGVRNKWYNAWKYLARAFEIVSLYSPRFESIFPHTQSRYSLPIKEGAWTFYSWNKRNQAQLKKKFGKQLCVWYFIWKSKNITLVFMADNQVNLFSKRSGLFHIYWELTLSQVISEHAQSSMYSGYKSNEEQFIS